jgi:hypothetical protein
VSAVTRTIRAMALESDEEPYQAELMEISYEALSSRARELVDTIACPINWQEALRDCQKDYSGDDRHDALRLSKWLDIHWAKALDSAQSGVQLPEDVRLALLTDQAWCDTIEPLRDEAHYRGVNLLFIAASGDEWIPSPAGYSEQVERFAAAYKTSPHSAFWRDLHIQTRTDRKKHHVATSTMSRKAIIKRTSRHGSASLMFPDCQEAIEAFLWHVLEEMAQAEDFEFLQSLSEADGQRICVTFCGEDIGASGGRATDHVCYEITGSAQQAHLYPVLPDDPLLQRSGTRLIRARDFEGRWSGG